MIYISKNLQIIYYKEKGVLAVLVFIRDGDEMTSKKI